MICMMGKSRRERRVIFSSSRAMQTMCPRKRGKGVRKRKGDHLRTFTRSHTNLSIGNKNRGSRRSNPPILRLHALHGDASVGSESDKKIQHHNRSFEVSKFLSKVVLGVVAKEENEVGEGHEGVTVEVAAVTAAWNEDTRIRLTLSSLKLQMYMVSDAPSRRNIIICSFIKSSMAFFLDRVKGPLNMNPSSASAILSAFARVKSFILSAFARVKSFLDDSSSH
ncbi:hypothetical protein Fmac_026822 [Flemingia macrophylla]|uniref:Uncharacterized protein n=1 Tax=Flemingia macrophylla TaxID=520843 RepID=A0ABD1LGH2_9FABA